MTEPELTQEQLLINTTKYINMKKQNTIASIKWQKHKRETKDPLYMEKCRINSKKYYELNKDKIKSKQKLYYFNNKDKLKEYDKQYKAKHKEKIREYNKQYLTKLKMQTNI